MHRFVNILEYDAKNLLYGNMHCNETYFFIDDAGVREIDIFKIYLL